MLDPAQFVNATPIRATAKPRVTSRQLWHQALWGSVAAVALLVAVVAGFTDVGAQRAAMLLSSLNLAPSSSPRPGQAAARQAPDADAAARQLAQTVRGLAEDRDRIMTRLAAVEHDIDDITGSITRQIEAVKATTAQSMPAWPADVPPVPAMLTSGESIAQPIVPPVADLAPALPANAMAEAGATSPPEAPATSPAYGADIGSASSMKALQVRWAGIRAAHARAFEGLQPVVMLRDNPRLNRVELRLVVGPFANAERAAQLCVTLAASHLPCEPTMFDGRHLALQ